MAVSYTLGDISLIIVTVNSNIIFLLISCGLGHVTGLSYHAVSFVGLVIFCILAILIKVVF
jgi:hypothetical protein